jgi:ABC-type glutathione transport system ATPase component
MGVSFSVAYGELLALLGPSGAGKSTTIKMLTGIVTPTSGEAVVAGVVPYRERERSARNVGAVFGVPLSFYIGRISLGDLPAQLAVAAGWAAALAVLVRLLWRKAAQQVAAQGG